MKATLFVILANLLIGCAPIMPQKINPTEITGQNKTNAYNFAKEHFESCKNGKYPKLTTANATSYLVKSLTAEDMENACEKINSDCGELLEIDLQEILKDKESYIYRYKAKYAATDRRPEIRVYTNFNHKFDGIIYKPEWRDKYEPFNP